MGEWALCALGQFQGFSFPQGPWRKWSYRSSRILA